MRLLNCTTLEFEEFLGKQIPPYAILSHTWEKHEISFKDYHVAKELRYEVGSEKILKTCELALENGYAYAWIDTCCIDKSSSAELSEAINSMFNWYQKSGCCFVYLSDFDSKDPSAYFRHCRWFTRGWTLQELIAPSNVCFYDSQWRYYGTKRGLALDIARITGISLNVITGKRGALYSHSVAQLMSWVAHRETTREEDMAYCLFGIFGVNLPLLYGEGERAFIRLQQEIIRNTNDRSIFAWRQASSADHKLRGIFARSPAEFADSGDIIMKSGENSEFGLTNRGLKIEALIERDNLVNLYFLSLHCQRTTMAVDSDLCIGIWVFPGHGKDASWFRRAAHELPIKSLVAQSALATETIYMVRDVEEEDEDEEDNEYGF